jgi:predicted  nucleic acid-binding Zn-ribbon protein
MSTEDRVNKRIQRLADAMLACVSKSEQRRLQHQMDAALRRLAEAESMNPKSTKEDTE